ncbi:MAG: NAD-dependent epimerase [Proteobacteria bacterium]|nr:NAD-dependent epimerase [Pseudomonadota bacterium]
MKILVTGAAGFIGSHVCLSLLERGDDVIGLDNLNDYYSVTLKEARLKRIEEFCQSVIASKKTCGDFEFVKMELADRSGMETLFKDSKFDKVIHLAAQAGVRYSIENPYAYIDSNIVGFLNVLEGCRHNHVKHLVYASSSSVYGANESLPFSVHDNVDHPLSLYAASKKSNELMAHTYSHLYELPTTGLRFFTVYGPWGRPDMALFLFTKAILADEPIDVFNYGNHTRDFTYIDDIVEGITKTLDINAAPDLGWTGTKPDPGTSKAPWRIYNIGNNNPVELFTYIETLEKALGKTAEKELLPLQPGDVPDTYADVQALVDDVDYQPSTSIEEGIGRFVEWYLGYFNK